MSQNDLQFLNALDGTVGSTLDQAHRLAFRRRTGDATRPGVVWLGGFKSDMDSTKAVAIDAWAAAEERAFLRFDYMGHGRSAGRFDEGTIGGWLADAEAALRHLTEGPQILVGSSMGGWITLLLARRLAERGETARLAGMVLIAPATDFTEALMWAQFSPAIRATIQSDGFWLRQSAYADDSYPITRALIEDGRRHLLLDGEIRTNCPVHILQGMRDPDVPWQHTMLLVEHLASDPVSVTLIKDGDHRLSRDEDVKRLIAAIAAIA